LTAALSAAPGLNAATLDAQSSALRGLGIAAGKCRAITHFERSKGGQRQNRLFSAYRNNLHLGVHRSAAVRLESVFSAIASTSSFLFMFVVRFQQLIGTHHKLHKSWRAGIGRRWKFLTHVLNPDFG
jgi:hypothetical protein